MPAVREELRDELRALLAARDELGASEEPYLIESVLDRLALIDNPQSITQGCERREGPRIRRPQGILSTLSALSLAAVALLIGGAATSGMNQRGGLGPTAPHVGLPAGYFAMLTVAMTVAFTITYLARHPEWLRDRMRDLVVLLR